MRRHPPVYAHGCIRDLHIPARRRGYAGAAGETVVERPAIPPAASRRIAERFPCLGLERFAQVVMFDHAGMVPVQRPQRTEQRAPFDQTQLGFVETGPLVRLGRNRLGRVTDQEGMGHV